MKIICQRRKKKGNKHGKEGKDRKSGNNPPASEESKNKVKKDENESRTI